MTNVSDPVPVLHFRHDNDENISHDPFAAWMDLAHRYRAVGSDQGEAPVWFMLRYSDLCTVMRDTRTFSRKHTDAYAAPAGDPLIPIHLDPPDHTKYRRLLNPMLSPVFARSLIPKIRQRAADLTEECADLGAFEYMQAFAFRYAPVVFFGLMGLPISSDSEHLVAVVDRALHTTSVMDPDNVVRKPAYAELLSVIRDLIRERRRKPADDFVSSLVTAQVDDKPIEEHILEQMCLLLLLAGLDTVGATLGYAMLHFATNPEDRRDLVEHPELTESAVEEILRFYPIDASIRYVTEEVSVAGCPMRPGDRVVLPFAAVNRDPDEFENPERFDIRRERNRHVGFGVGPHRCAGSHLARVELAIALEEWHKRIPDYSLAGGAQLTNLISTTVYRLESLPLILG
jgi:cytochrome P450